MASAIRGGATLIHGLQAHNSINRVSMFRYLVTEAKDLGAQVLVRHNLTVMFEPGQEDLPEFFRDCEVEVISSLPTFWNSKRTHNGGMAFLRSRLRRYAA